VPATEFPVLRWTICTAESVTSGVCNVTADAFDACELGADGVIVSNHGGRQMDAAPASIEVLPEIVRAIGHRCTVMLDRGVRSGTDVLRAVASGAACVFSGRSFYYGLGALGERWLQPRGKLN